MARLRATAAIGGLGLAVWLAWGRRGFANYDALYSLVWGRQIAHGHAPDVGVSLSPTPHPLADLAGTILTTLFGARGAEDALVVLAFAALGALGYLVYALGREWFGVGAGLVAAAVILTREPVLSYGTRAYVDVPYLALVLGALLVEARRPRAGRPVLIPLAVAGLIRPEAWLFSVAYLAWLWWPQRRVDLGLIALAAAAPLLWFGFDLLTTGDPLHSLTGTRDNTQTLHRVTGLQHVPTTLPRRLGEILREPVLVGAAGGGLLSLWLVRERARLGAAAGVLAVLAFALLAAAGLPIITRYAFGIAALLAVFCGAGAFGWTTLEKGHRWRRPWMAFGALTIALLLVFVPSQRTRLERTQRAIAQQQRIRDDLYALLERPVTEHIRPPLGVVNHRLVPAVALVAGLEPSQVVPQPLPAEPRPRGYLGPADATVARRYVLDPRDPSQAVPATPRGYAPVAGNRSWRLFVPAVVVHRGE